MQLFQQKTKISLFDSAADFANQLKLNEDDFILTSKSCFDKYFLPLNLQAHIAYKSAYGSFEPTDVMIDKLILDFKQSGCSRIIAIGGGSVIDMAKVLILKDVDKTEDAFLRKIPLVKAHEFIAVPTTCGSGSEVSSVSIVSFVERGTKLGLADESIIPDQAALIPELLREMPYEVFATSAIDALIHALESFVCPKSNPYTDLFSEEATRLIVKGFQRILAEGIEARFSLLQDFLLASNMAGIAFANAGTGAVHALSYPLSGHFNVAHGEACYQFFTAVFKEYQRVDPCGKIKRVEKLLADILGCSSQEVFSQLEEILDQIVPRHNLQDYGMTSEDIESYADNVLEMQQRLLNQSYVKLSRQAMIRIYKSLL